MSGNAAYKGKPATGVAFVLPWILYIGFVVVTVSIENTSLRDVHSINWITSGKIPASCLVGIAMTWVVSRVWLGWALSWSVPTRIAGLFGIALLEAGIGFVIYLIWAVGMIGGPINPG